MFCIVRRPIPDQAFACRDESPRLARSFVNVPFAKGLVLPYLHILRHKLRGQLKNEDVIVPVAAPVSTSH